MNLTDPQKATLKADITAKQATGQPLVGVTNEQAIANFYNAQAAPAYIVEKTLLSRHDILTGTSFTGTLFGWAGALYITRAQGERDAFREMFNTSGTVNPSLPSIKAAFNDIFSGVGGLPNRTHITAMSKRPATVAEKLLATGLGTDVAPSTLGAEGTLTAQEVANIIAGV